MGKSRWRDENNAEYVAGEQCSVNGHIRDIIDTTQHRARWRRWQMKHQHMHPRDCLFVCVCMRACVCVCVGGGI